MSLYPFPPRRDRPPPVPPKPLAVPRLSCDVVLPPTSRTQHRAGHKRSISSLSQRESPCTSPNSSPTKKNPPEGSPVSSTPTDEKRETTSPASNPQTNNGPEDVPAPPKRPQSPQFSIRLGTARQRAKDVWQARRRGAAATMTTVQETSMDSPTIPGCLPVPLERKPSSSGWRQCVFGETLVSRIMSSPEKDNSRIDLDAGQKSPEKEYPRLDFQAMTLAEKDNSRPGLEAVQEQPTAEKDSSRPDPQAGQKQPSPVDIPVSPKTPWPSPDDAPPPAPRGPSKVPPSLKSAPLLREGPQKLPVEAPRHKPQGSRGRADSAPQQAAPRTRPQEGTERPEAASTVTKLPAFDENDIQRHKRKKSSISQAIPRGVRPAEAASRIAPSDMAALQSKAKKQSEKFEVLSPADIDALARELSQLESRCQYLRDTRRSLRKGRRALHTRLLLYLRSATSAAFSQDSLLKQEEALAELDAAIDDWETKLEKADDRRMQLKQKLLEHLAATMAVPSATGPAARAGGGGGGGGGDMETPPATPERTRQKYDRESITVYALLADVKHEIECATVTATPAGAQGASEVQT